MHRVTLIQSNPFYTFIIRQREREKRKRREEKRIKQLKVLMVVVIVGGPVAEKVCCLSLFNVYDN